VSVPEMQWCEGETEVGLRQGRCKLID
jgi:hypothetical protein